MFILKNLNIVAKWSKLILNCESSEAERTSSASSKGTKDAENIYAPLVMVSIGGQNRTLTGKIAYQNGSIDTSFDPPLFSFDSTFNLHIYTWIEPIPYCQRGGGLYITLILFILLFPLIYLSVPRKSHIQLIISESTIQIETNGGCCC